MEEKSEYYGKAKVYAFHHQWLYGSLPLTRVKWILQYEANTDKYTSLSGIESSCDKEVLLEQLITTNAQHGVHSTSLRETAELTLTKGEFKGCICPEWGDNNDGITVMDFTGKKPAYAFVHLCDFGETRTPLHASLKVKAFELQPLTAEQYLLTYYDKNDVNWKLDNLIKYIDRHARLLTIEELHEMFPTLYAKLWKERETIIKNPKNIPTLLGNFMFGANQIFAESILAK